MKAIINMKRTIPSHLFIRCVSPSKKNIKSTNKAVAVIIIGQSWRTETRCTFMGDIMAVTPKTSAKFAMFEPITFPILMSLSSPPSKAAPILTRSSGADVPKETTVIPITSVEICAFNAKPTEPFTKKSPPKINVTKPRISHK